MSAACQMVFGKLQSVGMVPTCSGEPQNPSLHHLHARPESNDKRSNTQTGSEPPPVRNKPLSRASADAPPCRVGMRVGRGLAVGMRGAGRGGTKSHWMAELETVCPLMAVKIGQKQAKRPG
jgi:hypothetical protein